MLTPLYHPTVGPQGAIAVLGHDPYHRHRIWAWQLAFVGVKRACAFCVFVSRLHRWNPTHMIVAAVQDFIKQLEVYALSPVASDRLRHEIAQVRLSRLGEPEFRES
jgi:hypothetical protein